MAEGRRAGILLWTHGVGGLRLAATYVKTQGLMMRKLLFMLLILPLSACFDADLSFVAHDDDTATMSANMKMGPDMYGMIAASGEDPCPDGVGTPKADGSFTCLVEEKGTIDELIAKIKKEGENAAASGGVNPNKGVKIERLEGPFLKLTFDLAELKRSAAEGGMDPAMMAMMASAFEGHGIHMTIKGKEITETNGTLSADRTTAAINIPLTALLQTDNSLPDQFVTILRTE